MRTLGLTSLVACLLAAAPAGQDLKQTLSGTVYAEDGAPAGGAIVWAAKVTHGPLERRETVANAKGGYSLPVDPGLWYFWARRGTQGGEGPAQLKRIEI